MENGINQEAIKSQAVHSLLKNRLIREIWGLFKYGVVGGSSLALHTGLYHLQSRIIWPDGYRTAQYVTALLISAVYNFTLHRKWTFSAKGYSHQMLLRYISVILISMGSQSVVFYIGVDLLHVYDYYVFAVSVVVASLIQYFGHRFFTFHQRFEKEGIRD